MNALNADKMSLETKPIDGWTYKARNDVFYNPRGVQMTDSEKIELAKKERLIIRENTRFKSNPWKLNEAQKNNLLAARKEAELGRDKYLHISAIFDVE